MKILKYWWVIMYSVFFILSKNEVWILAIAIVIAFVVSFILNWIFYPKVRYYKLYYTIMNNGRVPGEEQLLGTIRIVKRRCLQKIVRDIIIAFNENRIIDIGVTNTIDYRLALEKEVKIK